MVLHPLLRRLRPAPLALVLVLAGVGGTVVATSDVDGPPPVLQARDTDLGLPDPSTYLVLSQDGQTFGEGEDIEVFDDMVWVPGDRQRRMFWIRNDGPDPGDVSVRLVLGSGDTLAKVRGFSLRVRGRAFERRLGPDLTDLMLPRRVPASELVAVANHLRPGRRMRVAVVGRLAFSAGNRTVRRASEMTLQLRMEQDPDSRAARGENTRLPGRNRG